MENNLNNKFIKEGITFDDVLVVPSYSDVLPGQVDLKTKLTKNINLNIPILSAAMDTVTESTLAISIAREGGIGVIHKNLSIEIQAKEVDRVKRSESLFINNPISIKKTTIIKEAQEIMEYYKISGLPVVDDNNKLIGILTNRDLKYLNEADKTKTVEEKMTKESLITGNLQTTIEQAKEIMLKNKIEKLPIVDETNTLKGLITTKDIDKAIAYPNACKDDKGRLRVLGAVGTSSDTLERVDALVMAGVDGIVIDSAHGHSKSILNVIKEIKEKYSDIDIIAGNVATSEGAQALYEAGADCIKVGIGPGSICTTRVVAGIGVPQITAINDVYNWAKDKNVTIIADGGIKYSGDIVKAIAAGAHSVMLGNIFAGTEESPGEELIKDGKKYKTYVGMGSIAAMKRGSSDRYFQEGQEKENENKLVSEGIEARVPFKGKLKDVVFQLIGGLRSGMGYTGSKNIEDLRHNAKFIKISNASLKESHPHDVELTKEAPNYNN